MSYDLRYWQNELEEIRDTAPQSLLVLFAVSENLNLNYP